jgi:L-rhamnonate dehydratase
MLITSVRTKLYRWKGPVKIDDTVFATPLSALAFQSDAQAPFRFFSWLVVEVETDDGRIGYGNAGLSPDVTRQIVVAKLAPLLVGENPLNTDYLYEKMYRSTVAFGRKGTVLAAISAVDIALWDLKGQICNQPVFMLLGGRTKPAIPSYYSRLYTRNIDRLQQEAAACKAAGFTGMKMRCGYPLTEGLAGLEKNVEMVRATREAVGDDVDVMVECYMGFDVPYARRLLKRIEKYNPRWVEELLLPDEIHNFAKLRAGTDIPLSGGEHEYTRWGFHDLLQAGALDIFQFDTNRVGGFTEAQRICHMAQVHGVEVIPHGGQMHNLHVCMSSMASPMAEYFPQTEIEVGNEMFWYIFDGEAIAESGMLQLDDTKPGMGLTLKTTGLENFDIV